MTNVDKALYSIMIHDFTFTDRRLHSIELDFDMLVKQHSNVRQTTLIDVCSNIGLDQICDL